MVDVCLVTPGLSDNSLGRTFSLWLLARAAGFSVRVVSGCPSSAIWPPLQNSEFAGSCEDLDVTRPGGLQALRSAVATADVVIVIKALPESFGLVSSMFNTSSRVIIDVDDPDIEAATLWLPRRERLQAMRTRYYWRFRLNRHQIRRYQITVSNPVLQRMYGGVLLPHVRDDSGAGPRHSSREPRVAFIGTPKAHKGIDVLRAAITRLAPQGFALDVTAPPPGDAKTWEAWHGFTSLAQGLHLASTADIIAIPSLDEGYARAQFPVKIIDAMLAARPVVASRVGPLQWVVGRGGELCQPNSVEDLVRVLSQFSDPAIRQEVGDEGRRRALREFTTAAVLPTFEQTIERTLG